MISQQMQAFIYPNNKIRIEFLFLFISINYQNLTCQNYHNGINRFRPSMHVNKSYISARKSKRFKGSSQLLRKDSYKYKYNPPLVSRADLQSEEAFLFRREERDPLISL